jgi:pseudaminic acid cytidylyltransferase
MTIAVIPARGGSKRIPKKNIKFFFGKPMIAWSIEAALDSSVFDRIVVSTDDPEIADVARYYGAEVPFVRPESLADDFTTTIDVIAHAVSWLVEVGANPEYVCCIYATAPFLRSEDICSGLAKLREDNFTYVFSATEYAAPIYRAFQELGDGNVEMFFPEHFNTRSQDLPPAFHDAGQFYWGMTRSWLSGAPFFQEKSRMIKIPRWRVQDIDTEEDWLRAEIMAPQVIAVPHD